MNRLLIVAALGSLTLALSAPPTNAADDNAVASGRQLALEVCSVCHVVAPDQPFAPRLDQHTPSFEEIANRPEVSAKFISHFIRTTHWDESTIPMTMPDPMLSDDQVSQVTRYILSLRKHP
jgi:mono/diheme cytochrome c family protein